MTYNRAWNPNTADSNDSLSIIYSFVKENTKVLDIGCSIGQLGQALKEQKSCSVYGIDIDAAYVEQSRTKLTDVQCADITRSKLSEIYPGEKFDYIIFADVLEHLPEADRVLLGVQESLSQNGSILISLPNVAHSSVRLALLEGRFDYRETGLLDKTHVKFYTYSTLLELLDNAKLVPVDFKRTYLGARDTEIPIAGTGLLTDSLISEVEAQPEATTYQFLVEAVPENNDKLRQGLLQRIKNLETAAQSAMQQKDKLLSSLNKRPTGDYISDLNSFLEYADKLTRDLSTIENHTAQRLEAIKIELFALKDSLAQQDPSRLIEEVTQQVIQNLQTTNGCRRLLSPVRLLKRIIGLS